MSMSLSRQEPKAVDHEPRRSETLKGHVEALASLSCTPFAYAPMTMSLCLRLRTYAEEPMSPRLFPY
eukprot:1687265-Rhodomonas_salina.3